MAGANSNMVSVDAPDFLGDEPNAVIWYRELRYVRSIVLAPHDVGIKSRHADGAWNNTHHFLRHGVPSM